MQEMEGLKTNLTKENEWLSGKVGELQRQREAAVEERDRKSGEVELLKEKYDTYINASGQRGVDHSSFYGKFSLM